MMIVGSVCKNVEVQTRRLYFRYLKGKEMKKVIVMMAIALGGCLIAHAAATGSCESAAASIKFGGSEQTKTVTLTGEWDSDSGEYDQSSGVYYFKATLSRSVAYTVWTTGLSTNDNISVSAYSADPVKEDDWGPMADFSEIEEGGGNTRLVMRSDDWYIDDEDPSESDPKSWVYYFCVEGAVGKKVTISFQQGAIIPRGREDNPQTLKPSNSVAILNDKLQLGGEYYAVADLKAGSLYSFETGKGTEANPISLNIMGEGALNIYNMPGYDGDLSNTGVYVVPDETGEYQFLLSTIGDDDQAEFSLTYKTYPMRAISAHPSTEIALGEPKTCTPGYMCDLRTGFYDTIIDEELLSFTAVKGQRYLAETAGAQTNLLMRIYDAKGTVLVESTGLEGTYDVKCGFTASAAGVYYVGVCQLLTNEFTDQPSRSTADLTVSKIKGEMHSPDEWDSLDDENEGATGLAAVPGKADDSPVELDTEGNGWHELGRTDWADIFMVAARKGITYQFKASLEDSTYTVTHLKAEVYYLSGTKTVKVSTTGDINPGKGEPLSFNATTFNTYYIKVSVAEGEGYDFPKYKIHTSAYSTSAADLGSLTVNTYGASGVTYSINSETYKYAGGGTVLLPAGSYTVKFSTAKNYKAPANMKGVEVKAGENKTIDVYYSDTFDPKDDTLAGATSWGMKNTETSMSRTLWENDLVDYFAVAGKDGQLYDFELKNATCDAVLSISNTVTGLLVENVTAVSQLALPAKGKYYLIVKHGTTEQKGGSYTLAGFFANVGAIKFAKTSLTAKDSDSSVSLTVNRTAKDGRVRIKYGTVAGEGLGGARPGVDYVPQNGILEWAAGDNKAKTIKITLIPDLVAYDEGTNKVFSVRLAPIPEDERTEDEYPGLISGSDTCTITLKESAKKGATVASTYAAKAVKMATVKTEVVPVETGKFFGVLAEDGSQLTNGLPKLASVTLTVSTAKPASLSAKVALAGKSYTFSSKGWDEEGEGVAKKVLTQVQKVNNVAYTNLLTVTLAAGTTTDEGVWSRPSGEVELEMNVPDANSKGVQEKIVYTGSIWRDQAKIQDYLTAVTNFAGYYTIALVPDGVSVSDGVPAGNGYLTVTIDNKGKAKVAGKLADNTSVSLSSVVCGLVKDENSRNGYAFHIPVYLSKSPYCFGGELRLFADETGKIVVDSTYDYALIWNNDKAAVTYDNEDGFALTLLPVGGYYDKVVNLQAYYLNYALSVGTADVTEFPSETFVYDPVSSVQPTGLKISVEGDALSVLKKTLVKDSTKKYVDFELSSNPCNVQLKYARATGLVTGSFSVWTEGVTAAGATVQKEVTGFKHNGVLLLARDAASPLSNDVLSGGYFTQSVKLSDYNESTKKTTTRTWTFSAPFNILGEDQGEPDWWADDWGERPLDE